MTTLPADALVERLARAWASIDGEADQFDLERANPNLAHDDPHYHGAYDGYLAEADELLRRSGLAAELSSLRAKLAEAMEVLEPIAECADEGNEDQPDDTAAASRPLPSEERR